MKHPIKPNRKLLALWDSFAAAEKTRFASLVKKSRGSLMHVVHGRRGISSELAVRMEKAASRMDRELSRGDLNETCGRCEYYRACNQPVRKAK